MTAAEAAASAAALVAAPGGGRQPDRHHHRVVRLLPLRHRRGAGVRQAVLPQERSARPARCWPSLTYALGFVARPIGGLVFGHFGDRIGRKRLLMASLRADGRGQRARSACCRPTPRSASPAPVLLAPLRLVQGFAVGGEWGGAVLMVGRVSATRKRRGFWAGWPQVGVPAGNLLAAGVLAVMAALQSEADFLAWGWRVPFLLSAVLVAVGWWVRSTLSETPAIRGGRGARRARRRAGAGDGGAAAQRPGGVADRRRPEARREHRLLHHHHLRDRLSGRDGRRQVGRSGAERAC